MKPQIIKKRDNYKFLTELPDIFTFILVAILIIEETCYKIFGWHLLTINNKDYKDVIITSTVVVISIILMRRLNILSLKFDRALGRHLGIVEVLKPHEDINFVELLQKKKVIRILTLSGTTTGRLMDSDVKDILKDRARKSSIVILLADPFSEAIKTRYKNDEPDFGVTGIEGIKKRLIMLYKLKNGLDKTTSKKLEVRIFKNYPTISVIQADRDLYSSVYGYRLRGSDCPIVHAEMGTVYGDFLIRHFNEVCENSVPINEWVQINNVDVNGEL